MNLGIGQINMTLGDIDANTDKVKKVIKEIGAFSDVIVFPELTLTGSPGMDLYANDWLIQQQYPAMESIRRLVAESGHDLTVILGFIDMDNSKQQAGGGIRKYNSAAAISAQGMQITDKHNLCDYDVFYESRQTTPGRRVSNFDDARGQHSTITICEDLFNELNDYQPLEHRPMSDVSMTYNLSSSPFSVGKLERRIDTMARHAKKRDTGLVYLNQVGGQDDTVFDGGSLVFNNQGELIHLSKLREEDVCIVDTTTKSNDMTSLARELSNNTYKTMHNAIVLGLKDYLAKTGIKKVVIGLSGGIDSALSLYFLRQVLPADCIIAKYMPSKYSTNSKSDAHLMAAILGVTLENHSIQDRFDSILREFDTRGKARPTGIAYENIQARIRGEILMEESNMTPGSMIINNSNRTEILLGYGTLHGDMIGAFDCIGDMNKREVYAMATWINSADNVSGKAQVNHHNKNAPVIVENIITKEASAELAPGQVDPFDYPRISDAVDALDAGLMPQQVARMYKLTLEETQALAHTIKRNEFKRREFYPISPRLKQNHIGIGRRKPVANGIDYRKQR